MGQAPLLSSRARAPASLGVPSLGHPSLCPQPEHNALSCVGGFFSLEGTSHIGLKATLPQSDHLPVYILIIFTNICFQNSHVHRCWELGFQHIFFVGSQNMIRLTHRWYSLTFSVCFQRPQLTQKVKRQVTCQFS